MRPRPGLIAPILVGPAARIREVAAKAGLDISGYPIVDAAYSQESADKAVALVRAGKAEALMKGSLHTDELMGAVVRRDTGLRTARRISHCFVMDVPGHAGPAHHHRRRGQHRADAAGTRSTSCRTRSTSRTTSASPRCGWRSCRRWRRSIPTCPPRSRRPRCARWRTAGRSPARVLDGPLALDNAISPEAAKIKKIDSPVAGRANVLVVPDLEAGNMLAKSLTFLAGADAAGIVLGARVPIILTSRADSLIARLASCAVAALVAQRAARQRRQGDRVTPWPTPSSSSMPARRASSSRCSSTRPTSSELRLRGQIEGLYTAPRFAAKDAAGASLGERAWAEGTRLGHDGAHRAPDRVPARAIAATYRLIAVGHRVVHGGLEFSQPVLVDARGRREAGEVRPARAAAPAAQPRADPRRRRARAAAAAGRLLRHRLPPRAAASSRRRSRCRAEITDARRAPLRLPRPVLRVHRRRAAAASTPKAAAGRVVVAHLGNGASMCAMHGRHERRQHHGLHRGRRPADGHALRLARSRAWCST